MEKQQALFKIHIGCGIIAHVKLIREAFIKEYVSLETITFSLLSYAMFVFMLTLEYHSHLVN